MTKKKKTVVSSYWKGKLTTTVGDELKCVALHAIYMQQVGQMLQQHLRRFALQLF